MEFQFTGVERANAVYDVVEHRVLSVPNNILRIPWLEQEEVFELVGFLERLRPLIRREGEE